MRGVPTEMKGCVFSRVTVLDGAGSDARGSALWKCRCECGKVWVVKGASLRSGAIKSCGCLRRERHAARIRKHGMWNTPEFWTWNSMLDRCRNPRHKQYKDYGGRGITVCDEWRHFINFFADMGRRPTSKHTLDRINNNGNYEPNNCRWATRQQQNNNTRRCIMVTIRGETHSIADWARLMGCSSKAAKKILMASR